MSDLPPETNAPQRSGWIPDQIEDREELGNPLARVEDNRLEEACQKLEKALSGATIEDLRDGAELAKHRDKYYDIAKEAQHRKSNPNDSGDRDAGSTVAPRVTLEEKDIEALVNEREKLFSGKGMLVIILTVSLAAFLQGHFQSSVNAGSMFAETVGIDITTRHIAINLDTSGREFDMRFITDGIRGISNGTYRDDYFSSRTGLDVTGHQPSKTAEWQLGGMNAIPFLVAAFPGAPLSLPVNYCFGRRGALVISAWLIVASSLGSAFATKWYHILGARVIAGLAMGIKAVSAPILASETAIGYWRGSTILAWQLWVACGIMIGFVTNFVIAKATEVLQSAPAPIYYITDGDDVITKHADSTADSRARYLSLQLILGAPLVPALLLLVALCFCYESPRFYMRPGTPNYNLDRAYQILVKVRKTKLLATRDFFLIWWSIEMDTLKMEERKLQRRQNTKDNLDEEENKQDEPGLTYISRIITVLKLSAEQFRPLFNERRLLNALWSSSIVALAQQLCGINLFAFYSNDLFSDYGVEKSMGYSFGFGGVNFFFGLLAMRSIDTVGRRRWLLCTLPMMACFLMASAIAYAADGKQSPSGTLDGGPKGRASTPESVAGIVFIYLFAAAYSPGLGTFPSYSSAVDRRTSAHSVQGQYHLRLHPKGLLTILIPSINRTFRIAGTVGFFSGMNVIALILVFLFVEETKRLPLEELDEVFDRPKLEFAIEKLSKFFSGVFGCCFEDASESGRTPVNVPLGMVNGMREQEPDTNLSERR
ncbi:hypothetical protein FDECE_9528 [Fusarium decemcellulare]|nr:hypothetical protein FDECE_9528 [Fusarium decemcellulare]